MRFSSAIEVVSYSAKLKINIPNFPSETLVEGSGVENKRAGPWHFFFRSVSFSLSIQLPIDYRLEASALACASDFSIRVSSLFSFNAVSPLRARTSLADTPLPRAFQNKA